MYSICVMLMYFRKHSISHIKSERCVTWTTIDVSFYDLILWFDSKMRTNSAVNTCVLLLCLFFWMWKQNFTTNYLIIRIPKNTRSTHIRKPIFKNYNSLFWDQRGKSVIRSEARKMTKIKCRLFDDDETVSICSKYVFGA